jgi:hypothetical protein
MGNATSFRVCWKPVICHLSTRPRFAHQTSPNWAQNGKRRINTIFNHFRDKPARAMRLIGLVKPSSNGGLEIDEMSRSSLTILNTMLVILNSIYRADTPSNTEETEIDDEALKELNDGIEEVFEVIREHLSLKDMNQYSHLKSE